MKLKIQALSKELDKKNFECGQVLLDNYIRKQAKQDVSRDLSACFVLVDDQLIAKGYYTLSASSINRDDFPDELRKKLPPAYIDLPTILLGRLAIEKSIQGKGYGEIMLYDALKRSLEISQRLGSLAVIVEPIDEKAKSFYASYGFILLAGTGKMFIPMKTVKGLVSV